MTFFPANESVSGTQDLQVCPSMITVQAPQAPYNIYRNQYFKITVNSIQAPGKPSDNFDNNQPIQPNTWISADIEVIPWEVIEEDHDL